MKLWEEKSGSVVVSVVFVQLYCTRKRELFVVFMQLKEEVVEENCVRSFCKPARGRAGCFRKQMDCLELCSATTEEKSRCRELCLYSFYATLKGKVDCMERCLSF